MTSEFAQRFIRESNLIEGLLTPSGTHNASTIDHVPRGHLGAYLICVEHALDTEELGTDQMYHPMALTLSDLKGWQSLIVREQPLLGDRQLRAEEIGAWRKGNIGIRYPDGAVKPIGAPVDEIEDRMKGVMLMANAYNKRRQTSDRWDYTPLEIAAWAHWGFERIHPFADGNGRTGRLLALWMLLRRETLPVLFTNADKQQNYYPCFEEDTPERMIAYFREHQVTREEEWA